MTLSEAQQDLRRAYVGGGPGAIVSALVWFATALMESTRGIGPAFTTLFVGGVFIFPVALLVEKVAFRRGDPATGNTLGLTALESTIAMLGGLLAAWLFLPFEPAYVLPLAAVAVGTHYLVFKTVYGDRLYWLLAALIAGVGLFDIFFAMPVPGGTALAVAVIELVMGVVLMVRAMREK